MASHGTAALVIAFLLVTVTLQLQAGAAPAVPVLTCNKAYGVKERETCFAVSEATGLTLKQFLSFNPNINCRSLFIGQWVCLDAASA